MISEETAIFIKEHLLDDIRLLALQGAKDPHIDMLFALRQIAGRQLAKSKIPHWYDVEDIVYPKHLSIEQCSSQHTAIYKANLCIGNSLTDLTGGFGVDFFFMSRKMQQAVYVEQQHSLVEIAIHNFESLHLSNISIIEDDAVRYLEKMTAVDTIYIDPARRSNEGRKTVLIEDCSPNLIKIEPLLIEKSTRTIIKLSPMLDITLATRVLSSISQIHVVSHNNECKELLFVCDKSKTEPIFHCVNLLNNGQQQSFDFTKEQEEIAAPLYSTKVDKYLYEPNASILKAGAYCSIAISFNLSKLDKNSHLYTSPQLIPNFPGRIFEVESFFAPNKKELKTHLLVLKQANIAVRNFPMTVDQIRKLTGLKDGGDRYMFASTLYGGQKVFIVCKKL